MISLIRIATLVLLLGMSTASFAEAQGLPPDKSVASLVATYDSTSALTLSTAEMFVLEMLMGEQSASPARLDSLVIGLKDKVLTGSDIGMSSAAITLIRLARDGSALVDGNAIVTLHPQATARVKLLMVGNVPSDLAWGVDILSTAAQGSDTGIARGAVARLASEGQRVLLQSLLDNALIQNSEAARVARFLLSM